MESFVSREVLRIAGAFRFLTRLPRDETLHFVQPLPYYCPHQHIGMTLVVRFRPQHLETHRLQQDLVFTFIVQPSKFCLVIFFAWLFIWYQGGSLGHRPNDPPLVQNDNQAKFDPKSNQAKFARLDGESA